MTDHRKRIADALEETRESLERVANSDVPFADRAEAALDWLDEYNEEDTDDE